MSGSTPPVMDESNIRQYLNEDYSLTEAADALSPAQRIQLINYATNAIVNQR
ncbi:hypothetical protein HK104_005357, partial [Borealophlyctis nickersoniae]